MSINVHRQQTIGPLVSSTSDFRLNFLQAILSTDRFTAGVLPFESQEHLLVLSRSHVSAMLWRFETALRRWRWDDENTVKHPIHWLIICERGTGHFMADTSIGFR